MKWLLLLVGLAVVLLLATRNVWRPGSDAPAQVATVAWPAACVAAPQFEAAARRNAQTFAALPWAPFGESEIGWDAYAPSIAQEIGASCGPTTPGFAAALASWQKARRLDPSGEIEPDTFEAMRVIWMLRRPFVVATRDGSCPPGAPEASLEQAAASEGYRGKLVRLRPGALRAYRQLRAAAFREVPAVRADPSLLALVSGYRNPQAAEARCLAEGDCGGPARSNCSAHRTGLAVDLYLGAAPGQDPISSAEVNRSYQAATPAYQWLVRNAGRFGFVAYPYEPWHWEWTGEPIVAV